MVKVQRRGVSEYGRQSFLPFLCLVHSRNTLHACVFPPEIYPIPFVAFILHFLLPLVTFPPLT